MKKLFAGIILSLAAVAAMAMPRPSEIESALAARDYQSAKSMTQEVLREKPDSAKAHLFNAYILAKEGNTVAASEELKNVNRLDRSNDPGRAVHNSALYGRTVAELERAPVQRVAPKSYAATPVATTYYAPAGESALVKVLKFLFYTTILGIIVYVVYKWLVRRQVVSCTGHTYHVDTSLPAGGSLQPGPYVNHGRTYDAPPHPIYEAPQRTSYIAAQPSTVVVNNGGSHSDGLLTGMLLSESMHHHHDHGHSHRDAYVEREYVAPSYSAPAYEAPRYEAPRTTDYETTRSSYSSGSRDDDDWKSSSSSSSSSSSNDSWSSDSSSSSDSGGGSWD